MEIVTQNLGWIALVFVGLFILLYKKISNDPLAMTSKYVQSLTIYNEENLQHKVIESLKRSGFRAVDYDSSERKFYARAHLNMFSWGENILIKSIESSDRVKLEFVSICVFPFQIFDWGKNKRNYVRFCKELNRFLH